MPTISKLISCQNLISCQFCNCNLESGEYIFHIKCQGVAGGTLGQLKDGVLFVGWPHSLRRGRDDRKFLCHQIKSDCFFDAGFSLTLKELAGTNEQHCWHKAFREKNLAGSSRNKLWGFELSRKVTLGRALDQCGGQTKSQRNPTHIDAHEETPSTTNLDLHFIGSGLNSCQAQKARDPLPRALLKSKCEVGVGEPAKLEAADWEACWQAPHLDPNHLGGWGQCQATEWNICVGLNVWFQFHSHCLQRNYWMKILFRQTKEARHQLRSQRGVKSTLKKSDTTKDRKQNTRTHGSIPFILKSRRHQMSKKNRFFIIWKMLIQRIWGLLDKEIKLEKN